MINSADIVVGLAWGDEAKGKITSYLSSKKFISGGSYYDFVIRWAGGNNAGHTVYVDGAKYKTHLVPSGIFYEINSIVGPNCVLHKDSFYKELDYLSDNGFDTGLVKVAPNCHIVQDSHIEFDKVNLAGRLGTTSRGIAPCYAEKAARVGVLAKDVLPDYMIWNGDIYGNILCEGAQGVWLDLNHGNYPYVTSSETLPYAACSIGFPPQKIKSIYGAAKIYDTRSGEDPKFPNSLLDDPVLARLAVLGNEYGVTTGRKRKVNWLDLDALVKSINITGATHIIISKCDVIKSLDIYKMFYQDDLVTFNSLEKMQELMEHHLNLSCPLIEQIRFSYSPEGL
jgi:adenylosuccinate synthase